MKNFLLGGFGKIDKDQKRKFKKMTTTGVNVERLSKYTEEYIKKTDDFNKLDKVEEILAELARENNRADVEGKKSIQKLIKMYKTQRDVLRSNSVFGKIAGNSDLELLNKYSDECIKKTKDFNDLSKVECTLVQLNIQLEKAKESAKEGIKKIIDMYLLQQKALLEEEETKSPSSNDKGNTTPTSSNNSNKKSEKFEEKEKVVATNNVKEVEKGGNETTKTVKPVINVYKKSETAVPKSPKRKQQSDNENEQNKKRSTWSNPNETNENGTKTAANSLFKSASVVGQEQVIEEHNKEIRIRFQFKANTKGKDGTKTHNECLKELLYEMMMCAKEIDKDAGLKPWKKDSRAKDLNGYELRMFSGSDLSEYVDIPDMRENLIHDKLYYQNGLRLKTKMTVYEFTERWSNKKYSRDNNTPFQMWKPIKPAEMQNYDKAYPIGYFVGTTERGEYSTIQKSISKYAGTATEVSFQFVNQEGVSARIWKHAREQAEKSYPEPTSKEHKRVKFSYAPSALVVYIAEKKNIKIARRRLITKFGKIKDGHWPQMDDGSRMRFIPIIYEKVKNQQVYNHLCDHLGLQAVSKAGEIKLDLEMWDIHEKRDYMFGNSLEQVMHGLTSTARKDIPIIKHIARKWSRSPDKVDYEIVIAPTMLHEAQNMLRTVRAALLEKFGNKMHKHFMPPHKKWNNFYSSGKTREESDPEIESFILDTGINDNYSKILLEGMIDNTQEVSTREALESMVIIEGHKEAEEKNNENEQQGDSVQSKVSGDSDIISTMTGLTKNSQFGSKIEWEELTIANEYEDMEKATEKQIKKVQDAIETYNITTNEIETWKTENENVYDDLIDKYKNQEYPIIRDVILHILRRRKGKYEEEKETDAIGKLIDLSEEGTASEMSALQHSVETQISQNGPSQVSVTSPNAGAGPGP